MACPPDLDTEIEVKVVNFPSVSPWLVMRTMEQPASKTFENCHLGGVQFGYVPAGFACPSSAARQPIRLETGLAGPKGYGLLHVVSYDYRPKQMQQLGFPTFPHFVHHVATSYTHIYEGKKSGRFQVACHAPGYSHYIVVQRVADERYWTVITGLPARPIKTVPIWQRPEDEKEAGESEPAPLAPEPRRRFTTLSLPEKPKPRDSES